MAAVEALQAWALECQARAGSAAVPDSAAGGLSPGNDSPGSDDADMADDEELVESAARAVCKEGANADGDARKRVRAVLRAADVAQKARLHACG